MVLGGPLVKGPKRVTINNEETIAKVRVILRVRPLLSSELTSTSGFGQTVGWGETSLKVDNESQTLSIPNPRNMNETLSYSFDGCYGPETNQICIFAKDVVPVVDRSLAGYNATIFAYGNTGAGKTFTMEGTLKNPGMIPLTMKYLLEALDKRKGTGAHSASLSGLQISYLEIYKEKIYDLLVNNNITTATVTTSSTSQDLSIRQDANHNILIPDLTINGVNSMNEFEKLWSKGIANRSTAATRLNVQSSRSHACLTIYLPPLIGGKGVRPKLHLIDLAGSEDNRRTENVGERLIESGAINKSLFVLGQVVDALNSSASRIPYRDSKLTRLLQDSLGGRAYALIIANVAPTTAFLSETCNTLNFAAKTRLIENNVRLANEHLVNRTFAEDNNGLFRGKRTTIRNNPSSSSPATISSADVKFEKRRIISSRFTTTASSTINISNPTTNNATTTAITMNGGEEEEEGGNPFKVSKPGSLQSLMLEARIEEKVNQRLREISKGTILSPLLKGDISILDRKSKNGRLTPSLSKRSKSVLNPTTIKPDRKPKKEIRSKKLIDDPLDPQVASIIPLVEPELLRIFNYGSLKEIKALREIGTKRAQAIIDHRNVIGEMKSMSELVIAGVLTNRVLGKIVFSNALGHVDFIPVSSSAHRHNPIILSEDCCF